MSLPVTRIKILCARLLYAVTTLFVGKERRVIERGGIRYEVDLAEGIELSLYLFGGFQRHVTANTLHGLPDDAVLIDVGANVGLMTLQFAKQVPNGTVHAFEPTHYAWERLLRNLSLNPELARRVVVNHAFLSANSSETPAITAYSSWRVDGSNTAEDHPLHCGTPKSADGVSAVSLDDYVRQQGLSRVDFIKIDTDGHEPDVLRGAAAVIARFRPRIVFEIGQYVMAEKGLDFGFYQHFFGELGYRLIDTVTGKTVTAGNYRQMIPAKGSTDLLALP